MLQDFHYQHMERWSARLDRASMTVLMEDAAQSSLLLNDFLKNINVSGLETSLEYPKPTGYERSSKEKDREEKDRPSKFLRFLREIFSSK